MRSVRNLIAVFAVFTATLAVAACAGGSGSGGGGVVTPPPPPPPPPPYASDCVATPTALSCISTAIVVDGPQVGVRSDGVFVNQGYEWVRMNRQATAQTSDDLYEVGSYAGASVFRKEYTNPQVGNDGLGPVRTATNVVRDINGILIPGDDSTLTLFDITNVLQGGLDYVQLGRVSPVPGEGTAIFFAVGQTVAPTLMPTTGSAHFEGGTRGAYTNGAGTTYATASDVVLNADFGTGAITGAASNFRMIDSAGAAVTPPHSLNFDFSADIAGSTFTGTATNSSMTGSVTGGFYGYPGPPSEVSLGFTLRETAGGGTLVGVGGLRK